jgi:copper resistance protein B
MKGVKTLLIGRVRFTAWFLLVAGALVGRLGPAAAQGSPFAFLREPIFTLLLLEQNEYRSGGSGNEYSWEAQGWVGGDYNRAWFKTQGDHNIDANVLENAEVQALYSRSIAPFWDFQIGGRFDLKPAPSRSFAVLGIQGLAPYWFEVNPALFVSHKGDVSARLEAGYDVLLTQRLIARPEMQLDFAIQDVKEDAVGSGLSSVELGLRLRYEIRREFAPYIGVVWERKVGRTADFIRQRGDAADVLEFTLGIRLWF